MNDTAQRKERLRRFASERAWEQFHTPKKLAMALAGEAGEFQWLYAHGQRRALARPAASAECSEAL